MSDPRQGIAAAPQNFDETRPMNLTFTPVRQIPPPVAAVTTVLRDVARDGLSNTPRSTGCGVNLLTVDGRRITSAATDPVAERLNALYDSYRENPCTTAWLNDQVVAADLSRSQPSLWATCALELGVRSIMATALRTPDRLLGTVLVYSTDSDAYRDDDQDVLLMFARTAALRIDTCMLGAS
ncbi:GAF domain-containing protein [Mycobacterium sp. SMC-4]|uniref:GAF domain-containing protein n=1 Tax=Mycobacterium sp. SMC-4 TaxID=2857059 RepID=UPI003D08DB14